MKTAIAYARYSSDNQRQESITAQLRAIYDYATKNNINIVKVYADEAQSATTDERINFQRMVVELAEINPEFVLVHKLDRFARNKYDAAFYRKEIKKYNARIIAVEQDFGEGPEAELMEGILEGFAEYFSSNLGREVKKGLTENAMIGKHCGGIPPLGYDVDQDGKYIINEREAKSVRLIFDGKLAGKSYSAIRDELNMLGHKTKSRGPKKPAGPFGSNSLHDILRNEKYIGTFILRKTSPGNSRKAADPNKTMRVENAIPSIIDQNTFDRVQQILDQAVHARPRADKPRYMLTGLMRCGLCGGAMVGDTLRGVGYYRCGNAKRTKECENKKRHLASRIEDDVLARVKAVTVSIKNIPKMADAIYKQIAQGQDGNRSEQAELKKSLVRVEKELTNLTNSIAAGVDPRLLADKINECGRQRDKLQTELAKAGTKNVITKEMIRQYLEKRKGVTFDMEDADSCIKAIRETIAQITLFADEIKIKPKGLI